MKSVEYVALSLMMMMAFVSAGPLPPSLNKSSHDDQNTARLHLLSRNQEANSSLESHQNVNVALDDFSRDASSNTTTNETSFSPIMRLFSKWDHLPHKLTNERSCVLSTCLTANLGSALQGGDETAGGSTKDPFGIGKK